jgi:hypothetical protein
MLTDIFLTATAFGAFYGLDTLLTAARLEGIYYIVHSIHNACIIALTFPEVITTLTAFSTVATHSVNMSAVDICVALHFYHIARYWRKFRFDDWLHHALMVGVAIPIGVLYDSRTFMGFSLFFTTGLPGFIDYVALSLVRNGRLARNTEKAINNYINVWIRSPGCITLATLLTAFVCEMTNVTVWEKALLLIPAALTYWNGQYFMQQVVRDYALAVKT